MNNFVNNNTLKKSGNQEPVACVVSDLDSVSGTTWFPPNPSTAGVTQMIPNNEGLEQCYILKLLEQTSGLVG